MDRRAFLQATGTVAAVGATGVGAAETAAAAPAVVAGLRLAEGQRHPHRPPAAVAGRRRPADLIGHRPDDTGLGEAVGSRAGVGGAGVLRPDLPILAGTAVKLRPPRPDDAKARFRLGRDPEILRMDGGSRSDVGPMTEADAEREIEVPH